VKLGLSHYRKNIDWGDNRMMRKYGPKKKEMAGDWRKLHNEELHNLNTLPYIITGIKSRWVGM
jgi:hypothetical protein